MKAKQKMEKELNRMLTEVIHKYGFEHRNTIYFAEVVGHTNKINFWVTESLFKCMMAGIEY